MATLDRLLAGTGLLFVGHADRLDESTALAVRPGGEHGSLRLSRAPARRRPCPGSGPRASRRPRPAAQTRTERRRGPAALDSADSARSRLGTRRTPDDRPSPPGRAPSRSRRRRLLDEAAALADRGRNDRGGRAAASSDPRAGARRPAAFYLLGLIHQAGGRSAAGRGVLPEGGLSRPRHDEALLALALLAERRGDAAAAAAIAAAPSGPPEEGSDVR